MRERPTPLARRAPLAVQQGEAARLLGVSADTFARYIAPELRAVRLTGKLKLYPVSELERWLEAQAEYTLPSGCRNR
jgi:excisionase family DNA binding protein